MPVTRTDLNNVYGALNISMWADVNNNKDHDEIEARVQYAINVATAETEAILRLLSYEVVDAVEHILVKHATALRAGDLLYTPRRFSDLGGARMLTTSDLISYHRKEYLTFFKDLQANKIDLGLSRNCRSYPAVEDPENSNDSLDSIDWYA